MAGSITAITAITANDTPEALVRVAVGAFRDELPPTDDPILRGPEAVAEGASGDLAALIDGASGFVTVDLSLGTADGNASGRP